MRLSSISAQCGCPAAAVLVFCALVTFAFCCGHPDTARAAHPPALAQGIASAGASLSGPGIFAMGGGRDEAALASRGTEQSGSVIEQFFSGSFLGAMLFGYPYTGLGTADITALALAALFFLRLLAARSRRPQGKDRFTVHSRDEFSTHIPDDIARNGDNGAAPRQGADDDGRGNPRDNAWTRRLGGDSGASGPAGKNAPWNRPPGQERPAPTVKSRAAAMWAHLSSEGQDEPGAVEEAVAEGAHVPRGFDVHDFLEGARALYVRLQQAWAARETESLAPFVTPPMLELLRKQAEKNPVPVKVDIMLVNATLKDVEEHGESEEVQVLFNVLMRAGDAAQPGEVDELWRFVRGPETGGMWQLSRIETT